jgi:hypothetical protein
MPTLKETWIDLARQGGEAHATDLGRLDREIVAELTDRVGVSNAEITEFLTDPDVKISIMKQAQMTENAMLPDLVLMMRDAQIAAEYVFALSMSVKAGIIIGAAYARAQAAELNDDVHGTT